MISTVSEYITDKLIKNCITFGFFLAGVLFGLLLILVIYLIFVRLKAKKPALSKEYESIELENDEIIKKAKEKLYSLDTKKGIANYLFEALQITVDSILEIAKEYTDGKKTISLSWTFNGKLPDVNICFDVDFAVEDFLIFVENSTDVVENTVLTVTDKYNVLVNSFLKFIGLGRSVRDITVKDVILFINGKAQKKEQKLIKAVEKKEKQKEKERKKREEQKKKLENKQVSKNKFIEFFTPKQKKNKKNLPNGKKQKNEPSIDSVDKKNKSISDNKFANIFKIKKKEESTSEQDKDKTVKISTFYKPINKVALEVFEILIEGFCVEARKLYGRGYSEHDVEEVVQKAEELLCEPHTSEGGDE